VCEVREKRTGNGMELPSVNAKGVQGKLEILIKRYQVEGGIAKVGEDVGGFNTGSLVENGERIVTVNPQEGIPELRCWGEEKKRRRRGIKKKTGYGMPLKQSSESNKRGIGRRGKGVQKASLMERWMNRNKRSRYPR